MQVMGAADTRHCIQSLLQSRQVKATRHALHYNVGDVTHHPPGGADDCNGKDEGADWVCNVPFWLHPDDDCSNDDSKALDAVAQNMDDSPLHAQGHVARLPSSWCLIRLPVHGAGMTVVLIITTMAAVFISVCMIMGGMMLLLFCCLTLCMTVCVGLFVAVSVAVSVTVPVAVSMAVSVAVSMAAKDEQVEQVDRNASDGENEHEFAINILWMNDTLDCLIHKDTSHHPNDEHRHLQFRTELQEHIRKEGSVQLITFSPDMLMPNFVCNAVECNVMRHPLLSAC